MIILNKILKFFSAFIVLLISLTGCDTITETSSIPSKPPKQSQQVIIEENTSSKPNTQPPQNQQRYNYSSKTNMRNQLQKRQIQQKIKHLLLKQKKQKNQKLLLF